MKLILLAAFTASLATATVASAQTAVPMKPPAATMPAAVPTAAPMTDGVTLNDQQAKEWIDKAVYSSDAKKLGEVAVFARDGSGKVTEMHADVGGFFGLAETRVRTGAESIMLSSTVAAIGTSKDAAK